jgi:hypothetical protein
VRWHRRSAPIRRPRGRDAQRRRFDDAVAKLRTTAASKPNVAVVAVAGFEDGLYFGRPARFPALKEYQGWGVNFVDTGVKPRNSATNSLPPTAGRSSATSAPTPSPPT